jgi:hypothetical protein
MKKLTIYLMGIVLIVSLSGCVKPGDFCDVGKPLPIATVEVATYLSNEDVELSNGIISHNTYGKANCPSFQ